MELFSVFLDVFGDLEGAWKLFGNYLLWDWILEALKLENGRPEAARRSPEFDARGLLTAPTVGLGGHWGRTYRRGELQERYKLQVKLISRSLSHPPTEGAGGLKFISVFI